MIGINGKTALPLFPSGRVWVDLDHAMEAPKVRSIFNVEPFDEDDLVTVCYGSNVYELRMTAKEFRKLKNG